MADSVHGTPKRKRGEGEGLVLSPLKFSFDPSLTQNPEGGSGSPRTQVAHRFRGLELHEGDVAIRSGGGVALTPSIEAQGDNDRNQSAKRQRHDEPMTDAPEPSQVVSDIVDVPSGTALGIIDRSGRTIPQPAPVRDVQLAHRPAKPTGEQSESIPDVPESKMQGHKRAGTPPLRIKKVLSKLGNTDKGVVDPVRAALTWHEDEITIYDPDDEDDDGTGINGVGFKPTAAIAHARVMKRRQQMAEYKRREESDARSRRNQRRRGVGHGPGTRAPSSSPPGSQGEGSITASEEPSPRKVRFMEIDPPQVAITTK